jgi:tetratricopeptide (TPR) repeat protein
MRYPRSCYRILGVLLFCLLLIPAVSCSSRKEDPANDEYSESEKTLQKFAEKIRLNPNDAQAYADRAEFYESNGMPDEAIRDYSEAIRIDPKRYYSYIFRGRLYQAKGMQKEADADFATCDVLIPPKPRFGSPDPKAPDEPDTDPEEPTPVDPKAPDDADADPEKPKPVDPPTPDDTDADVEKDESPDPK